jgi:hypothetical protein
MTSTRPTHISWLAWNTVWVAHDIRCALIDSLYGRVPCLALVPVTDLFFLLNRAEYKNKIQWNTLLKEEGIGSLFQVWEEEARQFLD